MWPYVPEICFGMFRERLTIILGYIRRNRRASDIKPLPWVCNTTGDLTAAK